jgi:hypothetical protein
MSIFDGTATAPTNHELLPPGLQPAVLVSILDFGTHESLFTRDGKDEKCRQREIGLFYELTSLPAHPILGMTVNRSFAPNSNLVKWMAGCLGRTIQIGEPVTPSSQLGRPVLAMIAHRTSETGKTYATLTAVMPPLAGQAVPALRVQPFSWAIGDGSIPSIIETFPFVFGVPVAQRIKDSPEFQLWAAAHPANPSPGSTDKDVPF